MGSFFAEAIKGLQVRFTSGTTSRPLQHRPDHHQLPACSMQHAAQQRIAMCAPSRLAYMAAAPRCLLQAHHAQPAHHSVGLGLIAIFSILTLRHWPQVELEQQPDWSSKLACLRKGLRILISEFIGTLSCIPYAITTMHLYKWVHTIAAAQG